jgi:hypothetical protein
MKSNKLRRPIVGREGLLEWLMDNTPSHCAGRALCLGRVKNLGWHCQIAGSKYPGWILELTTQHGRKMYIAVISDTDKYENRCYELTSLAGCVYYGGDSELYRGDR